ncbi:MAG: PKD domain-containing protein [Bacteroides sp.]|jgi:PKD repeat protein|nr:PKD domain-containing protein [Bacteroides sp.]
MGKNRPLLVLLLLLFFAGSLKAQTDTEFWFVAPRVTEGHGFDPSVPNYYGGRKFYLRFASMSLPATITIDMPANPAFTPIEFTMPANAAHTEDLSDLYDILWHPMPNEIHGRGLHITSTTPVTAYYEIGTYYNTDIFSLKGKNALGTNFYVPFQNTYRNGNYSPLPFSTINIVATQDNTVVKIIPTNPVYSGNESDPFLPGDTITVLLNRADTYAAAPNRIFSGTFPRIGQRPQYRLTGSRVISNKPIAITSSDDSVDSYPQSCRDLVGDQIVPVNIIGTEYIAMRGRLNAGMQESVYVMATENNTELYIDGSYVGVLNEAESFKHQLVNQTHHIQTTKPSYVYHVAGFGCEMGGAILPPVNFCNGSSQISFTRSKEGTDVNGVVERFFLNIMVRAGAEDGFILNGSTTMIPASSFNPVPGTTQWLAAEFEFTNEIPAGSPNFIENTKDLFHLAIINGGAASGTMYGYFSDFNQVKATSMIVNSGTEFEAICYGQSAQLIGGGGIDYVWSPPDFLDDPYSQTPIAFPDTTMHYTVIASGACGLVDSASVTIRVTEPLHALFSLDETVGCSPFEINIVNESIGVEHYSWRLGDGTNLSLDFEQLSHLYVNNSDTAQHYNITLIGRNDLFCVDTMTTQITVYPEVKAVAGNDISGCAPLHVDFVNASLGADTYLWRFGDGASSVDTAPVHTFHNYSDTDTTYAVVLKARNDFGCEDFDTVYVHVKPYIKADFEFDPPQACHPYELEITNNSYGVTQYVWNFDDGYPEQNYEDTTFVYSLENFTDLPEVHNISLIVSNDYGCVDTLVRPVIVYPYIKAEFTPDVLEGCNPLTVNFENLSVGAQYYDWDFGNASGTSSGTSPVFEFENPDPEVPAVFNVSLVASSLYGCRDTTEVEITVYPRVEAEFAFDYSEYCAPQEVIFYNQAIGATSYMWNFGDGSSSDSDAGQLGHVYSNTTSSAQTYQVSLWVQNDYNCFEEQVREITIHPEVVADFSMESSGCHPLEVSFQNESLNALDYFWDFGDGGTATLASPSRTFTNDSPTDVVHYDVRLISISAANCRDTISLPVTVYPKPEAAFEMPDNQGCAPFEVSLIDQSIGNTFNQWTFGDGSEEDASPGDQTHTYLNTTGDLLSFQPRLIVTNDYGCKDTITMNVMAYPMVLAEVSLPELAGCHPFEAEIFNLTSGATATMPYEWNYGDGSTSIEQADSHTHIFNNFSHTESAFYTTTMRATNVFGCRDSVDVTVEVYPRPKALFDAPEDPECSPFEIVFDDLSLGATRYAWDFGDGHSSNTEGSVSNVFVQPADQGIGWFTVNLEVENNFGCVDTFSRQVAAYPVIQADYSGELQGCHPLTIDFVNITQGGDFYVWDFTDGVLTNEVEPQHEFVNNSFTDPLQYQVKLLAESEFGCESEITRTITVYPRPNSEFDLSILQGCSPLQVLVDNQSVGGTLFDWELGEDTSDNGEDFEWIFRNLTDTVATYPVVLQTMNDWGCDRTFSQNVRVYPEVEAEYTTASGFFEGCTPLTLDFVNQTLRANQYEWIFADNTQSIGENPEHVFYAFDQETTYYDVLLTATSPYGCQDTIEKLVTVYPQPVADFSADPYEQVYPNTTVIFENQSLPGQWLYTWSLDDGNIIDFDEDPGSFSHTYRWTNNDYATRIYNVNLQVENAWCSDNITRQVIIHAPKPVVEIQALDKGCPPFEVKFSNNSLYGLSYMWDFDDGTTSGEVNPLHTFVDPGQYEVKLLVYGEGGVDSTSHIITVHQPPVADFRVMPEHVTLPYEPIQLVNLSSLAYSWEWDLGDGTISNEFEPLHYYQQVGIYDISLTVGNNTDPVCYDTVIKEGAVGAEEDCALYFPDAFTPDENGPNGGSYITGDPLNHIFYPVYTGIEDYVMEIYTRWGELVFRTEDLEIGWDGYYRGKLAKMDVYVWKVWYTCAGTGRKVVKAGDVTLIR